MSLETVRGVVVIVVEDFLSAGKPEQWRKLSWCLLAKDGGSHLLLNERAINKARSHEYLQSHEALITICNIFCTDTKSSGFGIDAIHESCCYSCADGFASARIPQSPKGLEAELLLGLLI